MTAEEMIEILSKLPPTYEVKPAYREILDEKSFRVVSELKEIWILLDS